MTDIKLGTVDGVIHISVEEFERVIADTRAEVIEEYKNALHIKYEENKEFAYIVSEGNIYKFDAMANLDLEEIDAIAEQLKE